MINKVRTENVYLLNKKNRLIGTYMVLDTDPKKVSILMQNTAYDASEVWTFSRKTGKLTHPKRNVGLYYIQDNNPMETKEQAPE